jgi:hypothetical protein
MSCRFTIQSPSVVAVYLTVPMQFVHRSNLFEWVNLRRRMSASTFGKCLMLLCRWGFIEQQPGARCGHYKQKLSSTGGASVPASRREPISAP